MKTATELHPLNPEWHSHIAADNLPTWEWLYENYAGIIYGCILNIVGNKHDAEKLFQEVFLGLKHIKWPSDPKLLSFFLWRHAGKAATAYVKSQRPIARNLYSDQVIKLISHNSLSVDAASEVLEIPVAELKKQLRLEWQKTLYNKIAI